VVRGYQVSMASSPCNLTTLQPCSCLCSHLYLCLHYADCLHVCACGQPVLVLQAALHVSVTLHLERLSTSSSSMLPQQCLSIPRSLYHWLLDCHCWRKLSTLQGTRMSALFITASLHLSKSCAACLLQIYIHACS